MDAQENEVDKVKLKNGKVVLMTFQSKYLPNRRKATPNRIHYGSEVQHAEKLLRSLYQQTTDNMKWLCNTVITVGGAQLFAQGLILRFFSGFFERRIEKFNQITEINLDLELPVQLDRQAVTEILKFMYTGEINPSFDIEKLKEVASVLEMPLLLTPLSSGKFPDDNFARSFLMTVRKERRETSDITLMVDGKKVYAHRSILATMSPYFAAMFKHGTSECYRPEVELPFLTSQEVGDVLTYIYNGTVYLHEDNIGSVMLLAEYMHIEALKDICCKYIRDNLSYSNSLQYFYLADILRVPKLHEFLVKYMTSHLSEVVENCSVDDVPFESFETLLNKLQNAPNQKDKAHNGKLVKLVGRWVHVCVDERMQHYQALCGNLGSQGTQTM